MALDTKVGSFAVATGSATQSIVGVGFQPTLVLFWSVASDLALNESDRFGRFLFGVDNGTDARSITYSSGRIFIEGQARTNALRRARATGLHAIGGSLSAATIEWSFSVQSFDADGFTIAFDVQSIDDAGLVAYMALGGSDLTASTIGSIDIPSGENRQVVSLGYKPSALILFGARTPAGEDNSTALADATVTFGCATQANQAVMALNAVRNTPLTQTRSTLREEVVSVFNAAGTVLESQGFLNAFDSDGFILDWVEAAPSRLFYLALEGPQARVGFSQAPPQATRSAVVGVGFDPAALFTFSTSVTPTFPGLIAGATYALAGSDRTDSRLIAMTDANGRVPETQRRTMRDQSVLIQDQTGIVKAIGTLADTEPDGFVIDWAVSDPPGTRFSFLALGDQLLTNGSAVTNGDVTIFTAPGHSLDVTSNLISIVWSGVAAPGHRIVIGESSVLGSSSNELFSLSAQDTTDSLSIQLNGKEFANGLELTHIDSGTVYIYTGTMDTVVSGEVLLTQPVQITGNEAADAPSTANPVQVAGLANENEPVRVADGDVVKSWHDLDGRVVTTVNFPAREAVVGVHGPHVQTTTVAGDTVLVAAPGVGQSIYVTGAYVAIGVANTNNNIVGLSAGLAGTLGWQTWLDGVGASAHPSNSIMYNPAWKLPENTALVANVQNADDIIWTVHFYTSP